MHMEELINNLFVSAQRDVDFWVQLVILHPVLP